MCSTNVIKVNSPVKCFFQLYKKRTETAKKEYLKQLAAYRASLVSQVLNTHTLTHTHTHTHTIQLVALTDFLLNPSFFFFRVTAIHLR